MTTTQKQSWLYEISFIRPILLFLLVAYHAFAPFCGAWDGDIVESNKIYEILANVFRAFRLEAFVFVSGYVFAYQVIYKHKFTSLKSLINSKFKRLIIPCWIFSILYVILFGNASWKVIQGVGHLWYLPCLFWCFIFCFPLFNSIKIKPTYCIIGLTALSVISFVPIPLQLNRAMYYMLFFYLGLIFWKNKEIINKYVTTWRTLYMWIAFFIIFTLSLICKEHTSILYESCDIYGKAIILSVNNITKIILAFSGIASIYATAVAYLKTHSLRGGVVRVGDYGYGVYIFHQFILIGLYYHSNFPTLIGSYWLPWLGTLIALSSSILFTWLFRLTKLGRSLI